MPPPAPTSPLAATAAVAATATATDASSTTPTTTTGRLSPPPLLPTNPAYIAISKVLFFVGVYSAVKAAHTYAVHTLHWSHFHMIVTGVELLSFASFIGFNTLLFVLDYLRWP